MRRQAALHFQAIDDVLARPNLTLELPADHQLSASINSMKLKNRLGDVRSDSHDRPHEYLLQIVGALTTPWLNQVEVWLVTSVRATCAIEGNVSRNKKEGRSPLSRSVPTIAPMVSVAATYIGAADDIGPSPIYGPCADATARTADHRNALDVRRLELTQGG